MKNNLSIVTIQSELFWENVDKNLEMFSAKLAPIEGTDMIILPEMFTTGFTMQSNKFAEEMEGKSMNWMKEIAEKKKSVIIGSLIIKEQQKYYNRLITMMPDGTYSYYDKRHLFKMGGEDKFYEKGSQKIFVDIDNWKICPLICYDLRFPVWSRNKSDYDVLVYIANWPEARRQVWNTLLLARAIENQSYVIGVNRIGKDEMGLSYSGDTIIVNPKGEIINNSLPYKESTEMISLSYDELIDFRKKFPAWSDADNFELK